MDCVTDSYNISCSPHVQIRGCHCDLSWVLYCSRKPVRHSKNHSQNLLLGIQYGEHKGNIMYNSVTYH